MAKVAIIVPVYNVEKYINECLVSLMCQSLADIEIICVDDCGNDKSMDIVQQLAKTDKRIKIIKNKQNSGLSVARNNGLAHTDAPYVMFCDSDDFFAPNMCEVMYSEMEKTGAELGIFGFEVGYEANFDKKDSDDKYFAVNHNGCVPISQQLQDTQAVCACGKIYRRSIIEEHDLTFPQGLRHEDEFWFPAYCSWVKNIVFVQERFYKYRRRAGSIMNNIFQKKAIHLDMIYIAIELFKYLKTHDKLEEKYNWFWGTKFFDMLGAALSYSGTKNSAAVYRVAHKFINENCDICKLDWRAQRKVQIMRNKTVHARRILGGVIRIKESENKKTVLFCGLPIWKQNFAEHK